MARIRVRIRYRKEGDLRFLGHHDLMHVWERLLRRAEVRPAMTEGFRKRPRVNFPSALAVGIGGTNEVVELELTEDRDLIDLAATLNAFAPPDLTVVDIEPLPDGAARFSQPARAAYEIHLPDDRVAAVRAEIERRRTTALGPQTADAAALDDASSSPASEANAPWPATVEAVDLVDGVLRMELRLGEAGAVRPRDLLATLGLADLETTGAQLVRTHVEVTG